MTEANITYIDRSGSNEHLAHIAPVGDHKPTWVGTDCHLCGSAPCGPHPDVLSCLECCDDWPCDVAANVANELEARAAELNCRDDWDLLMGRVRELRGGAQ